MLKARQIEAFRAVMAHGGVGRAAEVLRISQPAVSRLIASLERDVGFDLFERVGRGLTPTPEAHLLLREVETYFLGLDRVAQAASAIREARQGQLRLSVMPALAMSAAPDIVEQIAAAYPDARITLDVRTAPRVADLVAVGQYDLGVAHLDQPRADLEELGAWDVACVCVMPREHPLAERETITPGDLAGVPVVLLAFETSTAQKLEQSFIAAGARPEIKIEAQPSYAAFYLAARGLGVAIIDAFTAATLATEQIQVRPFHPRVGFGFKLIRPTGVRPSLLARESAQIATAALSRRVAGMS